MGLSVTLWDPMHLQVDSVKTELKCRTPHRCGELVVGKPCRSGVGILCAVTGGEQRRGPGEQVGACVWVAGRSPHHLEEQLLALLPWLPQTGLLIMFGMFSVFPPTWAFLIFSYMDRLRIFQHFL